MSIVIKQNRASIHLLWMLSIGLMIGLWNPAAVAAVQVVTPDPVTDVRVTVNGDSLTVTYEEPLTPFNEIVVDLYDAGTNVKVSTPSIFAGSGYTYIYNLADASYNIEVYTRLAGEPSSKVIMNNTGVGYETSRVAARNVTFMDSDNSPTTVTGAVYWDAAIDQQYDIDLYTVYFANGAGVRQGNYIDAEVLTTTINSQQITEQITSFSVDVSGLSVPTGATHIAVASIFTEPVPAVTLSTALIPLWNSRNYELSSLDMIDTNPLSGIVDAQIKWDKVANEASIQRYHVYYERRSNVNPYPIVRHKVGEYDALGFVSYNASFSNVPSDVIYIVVRVVNSLGNLAPTEVLIPVYDLTSNDTTWNEAYFQGTEVASKLILDSRVDTAGYLSGRVSWEQPNVDPTTILGYNLYYLNASNVRIGSIARGQQLTDTTHNAVSISHIAIPAGATQIGIYSVVAGGEGDTVVKIPLGVEQPMNIMFTDTNMGIGTIEGTIYWSVPLVKTDITSFSVFFTDDAGVIVGSEIHNRSKEADPTYLDYSYNLPSMVIPANATRIGVRSNTAGSSSNMATMKLWDYPAYYPTEVRFIDENPAAGTISGIMRWKKPQSEAGIHHYRITYITPENAIVIVADVFPVTGTTEYSYAIPTNIAAEQAVLYLNVQNEFNENGAYQHVVTLMDNTYSSTDVQPIMNASLQLPAFVSYYDENLTFGAHAGYVYWSNPTDVTGITGYQLSYVMANGDTKVFAHVKKKSQGNYNVYVSSMLMPTGVVSIAIRSTDADGKVSFLPVVVDIEDHASGIYWVTDVNFNDVDMTAGEIAGKMTWVLSAFSNVLQEYEIYFTDSQDRRISKIGAVAATVNQFDIPTGTLVPANAARIAVFSKGNVLMTQYWWHPLYDSNLATVSTSNYRLHMSNMIDTQHDGVEIDDMLKLIRTSYDMNGDNVFDAADVRIILSLTKPINVPIDNEL